MDDQDIVLLAEAMGARRVSEEDVNYYWPPTYICEAAKAAGAIAIDYVHVSDLPDPSIDANVDYAVLEWLRENHQADLRRVLTNNECSYQWNYKIGNYGRTAVMIIKKLNG